VREPARRARCAASSLPATARRPSLPCPSRRRDVKRADPSLLPPFASAFLERIALGDVDHQTRELVVVFSRALDNIINRAAVVAFDAPTKGVGQQFLTQTTSEGILPFFQNRPQLTRPLERLSARQRAG